jgi:hypothetical protein
MIKGTFIILILLIISCKKETKIDNTNSKKDCNCDRITSVSSFYTVGMPGVNEQGNTTFNIATVNDCSFETKNTTITYTGKISGGPTKGMCWSMPY